MSEGRRLCAKCHQPIRRGEQSVPLDVLGATGPGVMLELHEPVCPAPPPDYQRAPEQHVHPRA